MMKDINKDYKEARNNKKKGRKERRRKRLKIKTVTRSRIIKNVYKKESIRVRKMKNSKEML